MSNRQVTIIEYPKCSTCRAAIKSLEAKGNIVSRRHIVEDTPTAEQLKQLITLSGLELKKWLNTSGQVYRQLQLKDKLADMSDDEVIALLANHGMLLKRPIVTDGQSVTVGYNEEQYEKVWS
ncbi:arsenate reductase family protein [Paenibacillus yanchengensis]|uniref:Arsenate reductase family protein n=1 Tax=Paenibacillus yanchengensis TaxID=2035833 RepID=A0ABW4YLS3_9BACL